MSLDDKVTAYMQNLKLKDTGTYHVYIDGIRFCTSKGKAVWRGLGPAKNALRNQFDGAIYAYPREDREEVWRDFLTRRVDFVEVK